MVLKVPGDSIQKVESEFTKIIDSNVGRDEKFRKLFSLMAEGHAETQSMMKEGFVGLAIQNAELNAELKDQNKALTDQLNQLHEQFAIVRQELQERKERERLLQEKDVAISNQQEEWTRTMKDAAESLIAIQDEYDAKLENAQRNLKREEIRTERELMKQDKKKSSRRIQLIYEREELTRSLSQLMVDERESAKSEYQTLKKTKSDTLAKNLEQVQSTNNEIQVLRSKMVYVQQELNMLENTSRKAHLKLEELEDERGSFRKQLKRSVKVAVGKIPLIGSKVRE